MRLATASASLIGGLILILASLAAHACEEGHWITNVSNNGSVIMLEDRSAWLVDSTDRTATAQWLPISNIVACDDMLINTDDRERADAHRIR